MQHNKTARTQPKQPINALYGPSFIASHSFDLSKTNRRARFIVATADLSARRDHTSMRFCSTLCPTSLLHLHYRVRASSKKGSNNPNTLLAATLHGPVYGADNPRGCPARTHARNDSPEHFQQTTLSINGIHLGVNEYGMSTPRGCPASGCPESPTSGTLVLLHGFTGSTANWQNLLSHLDLPGWRIIALDMLGHGQSDAPVDPQRYSIEHCQQDIIASLRKLGIKPGEAILLGYSMGGRIALYSAFSGFFRAIILESASPGLASPTERAQRRDSDNALADRIERDGLAAFVTYWEQLPLFSSQSALPRETRASLRELRLHNRPVGLANSLRGLGTGMQPSLHDQLQELPIPVLLIAGALDTKYCAIARHMAAALPNSTLHIVSNAGHTIHLEQPAMFAALVRQFCMAML